VRLFCVTVSLVLAMGDHHALCAPNATPELSHAAWTTLVLRSVHTALSPRAGIVLGCASVGGCGAYVGGGVPRGGCGWWFLAAAEQ
ncbi:MAG: hypothetical protein ACRDTT_01260, partial [Pseudonocardiaceae bacterium]